MNQINAAQITKGVRQAFLQANVDVRQVGKRLETIEESSEIGREILGQLTRNAQIAYEQKMPACQDTGMAVVFVDLGQEVHIVGGDLSAAIDQGVREAYEQGYFRKSVVDPLSRENTGDNTPAVIHYDIVPGEAVRITALPKGFGSENMSEIAMLTPSVGEKGIRDFVIETVREKGANACPPLIVGVGIGGTFERAALLAKKSLLRELDSTQPDPLLAQMEQELLREINQLGIGPMGLGGDTTALAVWIQKFPTHIAGLPVAVNMMCHALRHQTVVIT